MAPRAGKSTSPVVLELAPDRSKRLSDATLVEASITARLLGMRILTLDATIALVPADLTTAASALEAGAPRIDRAAHARSRSGSGRHRLADAVNNLEEGAKLLAEARRNGS